MKLLIIGLSLLGCLSLSAGPELNIKEIKPEIILDAACKTQCFRNGLSGRRNYNPSLEYYTDYTKMTLEQIDSEIKSKNGCEKDNDVEWYPETSCHYFKH